MKRELRWPQGKCACLSESTGPGLSPDAGHNVVFLGKPLYSHSTSHPGVQNGIGESYGGGNPAMDEPPIQGGGQILIVSSCYENWDTLWH